MSEAVLAPWRRVPRAAAPYAERADVRDTRIDRFLLATASGLTRPFSRALREGARVAALAEREQAASDGLSDVQLRERAIELRGRLVQQGLAPELVARAFALVRTAAGRTIGQRHYPVQMMGGYAMLQGQLAEMGTGEGKTLAATLPAATAALAGLPVHVVTVNDYLAGRDGAKMRAVYAALGLTTGIAQHGQDPQERRAQYAADICYCTNSELGFDYLRDGLLLRAGRDRSRLVMEKWLQRGDRFDQLLLRGLHFALVDEADSVLVDEARTPLIIAAERDTADEEALFGGALRIADGLVAREDFRADEADRLVRLTDDGRARVKDAVALLPEDWRSARGSEEMVEQALSARLFYERDLHYVVRDGKVQIVDEYTGRVLADRSWERGLQQLIEAKEGCDLTGQRSTLARITYQRLFRRYLRLCGMTGTGLEVAAELKAVFGLDAVAIPPNRPRQREDLGTRTFLDVQQKWDAVAASAAAVSAAGRSVLVGTRSVAASEELSERLRQLGLEHVVLNARQDAHEAEVVAQAGQPGRVTITTNMAGRGTDIALEASVRERGGLHVILTEFHESGRIDRQLYGRCGRQGEPGSHEAIVSVGDEIFQRHAPTVARAVAARYAGRTEPLPRAAGTFLRTMAQRAAERLNSHIRRATLESDRKLDTALAFTGKIE
jgi:preprotein translocase subunit SecA